MIARRRSIRPLTPLLVRDYDGPKGDGRDPYSLGVDGEEFREFDRLSPADRQHYRKTGDYVRY